MTLLLSVIDEMYGKGTLSFFFFFKKAPNSSKVTALLCILTS